MLQCCQIAREVTAAAERRAGVACFMLEVSPDSRMTIHLALAMPVFAIPQSLRRGKMRLRGFALFPTGRCFAFSSVFLRKLPKRPKVMHRGMALANHPPCFPALSHLPHHHPPAIFRVPLTVSSSHLGMIEENQDSI